MNMTSTVAQKSFSWIGNLIKLLPTGTVFVFQYLNPILLSSGHCNTTEKTLSAILIGVCGLSCIFASFTDSYLGTDNKRHYGIVTTKGMLSFDNAPAAEDLSKKKLKVSDFSHAAFSALVFAALSLLDANTVSCFYPKFESQRKIVIQTAPCVMGVISGAIFVIVPSNRYGIGYPPGDSSS